MRSLYLSYNDATGPLVQSQVVPYLMGLAERGHRFTLVTWQRPSTRGVSAASERMERAGIRWHALRYHAAPRLPATLYDIAAGIALGLRLMRRERFDVVHARSDVPAAVAWGLHRLTGIPFIYDMRGMMADEYAEGGVWSAGSLAYRVTKQMEGRLLTDAAAIVVLTDNIAGYLRSQDARCGSRITVVPCCVDLGRFTPVQRRPPGRPMRLVYAGSVGTWYSMDAMADFVAFGAASRALELLLLTPQEGGALHSTMARRTTLTGRYRVIEAAPESVPAHLASADVGLSFRRASFSQRASSPIKISEYLACGLPVVSTPGVGDVDQLLERERVGVVVRSCDDEGYRTAWERLDALCAEGPRLAERCRAVAERDLSLAEGVRRYASLYDALAARTVTA